MSRTTVPLQVTDLSPFARTLRHSLAGHSGTPTHVELLNMLAKAAGFANYQHLRANAEADGRLAAASEPGPRPDLAQVEKAARYFDAQGVLASWPARYAHQMLCLWVLWSRIPRGRTFTEVEISDLIREWHLFGDHALIRRAMIDGRMLERNLDGSAYRRLERAPPAELAPLLEQLRRRTSVEATGLRSPATHGR